MKNSFTKKIYRARELFQSGALQDAVFVSKEAITAIRSVQKTLSSSETKISASQLNNLVGESYYIMGSSFLLMGKESRALASFILSAKFLDDPQKSTCEIGKLSGKKQDSTLNDIEDIVSRYHLLSSEDSFGFSCTMCGECCRSADYIIITPLDMFLLTRSPALQSLSVRNTAQLFTHSFFKKAFHFITRNGFPICYLRPVTSKALGHCQFAFPLYTARQMHVSRTRTESEAPEVEDCTDDDDFNPNVNFKNTPSGSPDMGDVQSGVETGSWNVESDDISGSSIESRDDPPSYSSTTYTYSQRTLLSFEDTFGLGLCHGLQDVQSGHKSRGVWDDDSEEGGELEEECGVGGWVDVEAVYNGSGRQALGCMLGVSHMPTMCNTYPVAPELTQADFWHVRTVVTEEEEDGGEGEGTRLSGGTVELRGTEPIASIACAPTTANTEDQRGEGIGSDRESFPPTLPKPPLAGIRPPNPNGSVKGDGVCPVGEAQISGHSASVNVNREERRIGGHSASVNVNREERRIGSGVGEVREPQRSGPSGGSVSRTPAVYTGWEEEERYVVHHTVGCEAFCTDVHQPVTPIRRGMYVGDADSQGGVEGGELYIHTQVLPGEHQVRVKDFLTLLVDDDGHMSGSMSGTQQGQSMPTLEDLDLSGPGGVTRNGDKSSVVWDNSRRPSKYNKFQEQHWFLGLVESLSTALPADQIPYQTVKTRFLNVMAKIWFNFDTLVSTKSRPVRSYSRLKREIHALSWTLVRETKRFLESVKWHYDLKYNSASFGEDVSSVASSSVGGSGKGDMRHVLSPFTSTRGAESSLQDRDSDSDSEDNVVRVREGSVAAAPPPSFPVSTPEAKPSIESFAETEYDNLLDKLCI